MGCSGLRECRLASQRLEHFGGSDDLASVALGVVGYVNERASDGCGQLLAAYSAEGVEVGSGQDANSADGIGERDFDFCEEHGQGFFAAQFGFE